jgi:hypothetical protein
VAGIVTSAENLWYQKSDIQKLYYEIQTRKKLNIGEQCEWRK